MSKQTSNTMSKPNRTKTLIVTETVRYEFEVPASMPESDLSLRRFFAAKSNPWSDADFSAVTERDFEIEAQPFERGSFTESETARPLAAR